MFNGVYDIIGLSVNRVFPSWEIPAMCNDGVIIANLNLHSDNFDLSIFTFLKIDVDECDMNGNIM